MMLIKAVANKKRKKSVTTLPKAAPTPLSRKASSANPPRGRTARPTIVIVNHSEVFVETPTR
jgi:hypothetical protein